MQRRLWRGRGVVGSKTVSYTSTSSNRNARTYGYAATNCNSDENAREERLA